MSGPGFRPHYTAGPSASNWSQNKHHLWCLLSSHGQMTALYIFLIWYLICWRKKQNKTTTLFIVDAPFHNPSPPKRAWSACHCQYLIPVLKFFAHLKKVNSFQWISISETIWIDRTEAEKYLSASRQKRAIEIYLYKNRHRHTPINIFWQLKFNDLENVKIESFRLV